jgi:general secretion pathway protein K
MPKGKAGERVKASRGSALIVTLLVIATLAGLTLAFSQESGVELSLAEYSRDGYKAYEAARAGAYFALALLANEDREELKELRKEWSTYGENPVPVELPEDVKIEGGIIDESGKVNVNRLIDPQGELIQGRVHQAERLFEILGLEEFRVPPLLDWLDKDGIERLDGAESHYYGNLPEPYECGNGPVATPGRLFLIKGFDEIERFGEEGSKRLLDYLTVYSDGRVNINTAPREVLESLSDALDSMVSESILEYREEQEFERVDDLRNVIGMDDLIYEAVRDGISVKGSAYTIEILARCREAAAGVRAVAVKEQDELKVVYWRAE